LSNSADGWNVQFLEGDVKTPLPRKLTFSDPEKIREIATRGKAWGDSGSLTCSTVRLM
jgi:hypothetical protein